MIKTIKPIYYIAFTTLIFASCKTTSSIVVPNGGNTIVDIPEKKVELTSIEKENWQHLDLATDTIPGMSVNKAYEFLKGKTGVEVIVGVVDSGTDLTHEDLKGNAWVNKNEISGNAIDDDKNGYVDDIYGWNFLGKTYKEHLEYERILMDPSITDAATLEEAKKYQEEKLVEAKEQTANYQNFLSSVLFADDALTKHFNKEDYTIDDINNIEPSNLDLSNAIRVAKYVESVGYTMPSIKEQLEGLLEGYEETINGDNLKNNYRTTGDNPYDINDKPGSGDANPGHSEKEEIHGSHVSGIIGAVRNNDIGMNGVANNVKIMAVRSVSDGDEYDKDVALGIRYAVDNGAKVINTSFGKGFSPNKDWVFDAIKYAAKKDVLIVNAAGNDAIDIDVEKTFPNDAPDLINEISDNFLCVGAMSSNYNKDLLATFSNYGKKNVDVFAPGVKIHATTTENEYQKLSGTSMASPSTAGVAALIRSYYPTLTASQVKRIIMNSGTQIGFEVLKPGTETGELVKLSDISVSGRIVNAYRALQMADKLVKVN